MEGDQISLTISDGTIITKAEQIKRMDEIKESLERGNLIWQRKNLI